MDVDRRDERAWVSMHSTKPGPDASTQSERVPWLFSLQRLPGISRTCLSLVCYPAHAVLFEEGAGASSILQVAGGLRKDFCEFQPGEGGRFSCRVARPIELLGLKAVLRGSCNEVTAETLHPCRIASIRRREFLDFLVRYPVAYEGVARELSVEMSRVVSKREIKGLGSSSNDKNSPGSCWTGRQTVRKRRNAESGSPFL